MAVTNAQGTWSGAVITGTLNGSLYVSCQYAVLNGVEQTNFLRVVELNGSYFAAGKITKVDYDPADHNHATFHVALPNSVTGTVDCWQENLVAHTGEGAASLSNGISVGKTPAVGGGVNVIPA